MILDDYRWQLEEREHYGAPARFLRWPMRTGKTKTTIDGAYWLRDQNAIDAVIVVAPVGVHAQWLEEIPKWQPGRLRLGDGFAWGKGCDPKEILATISAAIVQGRGPLAHPALAWLCLGKEHLVDDRAWGLAVKLVRKFRCLFVVDESHHFRKSDARRTRRAIALSTLCPYRRLLSGTPDDNSPMNLFTQYEILERGSLGCRTFTEFRERYAELEEGRGFGGRAYPKIVGYKNVDELRERSARLAHVVHEEQVEGLALPTFQRRPFELGERERRHYDAMRMGFPIEGESTRDPETAATMLLRLQQIASGFTVDDVGQERGLGESRPQALVELAEEIGYPDRQLVVWARFTRDLEHAKAALDRGTSGSPRSAIVNGDTSKARRAEALRDLNAGRVRAIFADPGCAGEGFDLSAARHMVWYSHVWDAAKRRQASARGTKIGLEAATVIDLEARDTVDGAILRAHGRKRETSDFVWDVLAESLGGWRHPALD